MGYSGTVRYNRDWNEGRVTTNLTPTLDLAAMNDIFRLDLSGTASERTNSDGPDYSDRSWEATWSSTWRRDWWPNLRASYGANQSTDDQSPKRLDTDSTNTNLSVDWDLHVAEVFYSYFESDSTDNVQATDETSTNHFARLQTGSSLLNGRVSWNFAQQYSLNTQDSTGPVGTPRQIFLVEALSGLDDTPIEDRLGANPALIDRNLVTPSLVIRPEEEMNIGIRADSQQVDILYLYTDRDLPLNLRSFRWDLYASENGLDWTLEARALGYGYNSAFLRFEIEVPQVTARYLKIVTVETPDEEVGFTEIQALARATSTDEHREFESYITNFGLGVQLASDLDLSYTGSLEKSTAEPGSDEDRRTQAGTLSWTPSRYFNPALSVSESWTERENDEEKLSRSYGLRITSTPLPTLDLSTGVTRSENFEDNDKITTSDTFSLFATATLYPDLTASLDTTYTTSDNLEDGFTTNTLGTRATLTARLNPTLTADLTGEHNETTGDSDSRSEGASLQLNWRPSEIFSAQGGLTQRWEEEEDTTSLNLIMSVAPTVKTQASLTYTYTASDTTTESYGFFWSWRISEVFSMQLNGSYKREEDENPWSIGGQLTARFSGP